jgi:transcriptional regulator with XRE-family HTH domain
MADRQLPAYAVAIRRARAERGWSRGRLAYELEQVIKREGMEPPARESLIRMLRSWQNGEHKPDGYNRERLIKALGGPLNQIDLSGLAVGTPLAYSTCELKTVELVAWVADHSSMSFREAYGAIASRVEQLHAQLPATRHADAHRRRHITRQQIAEALVTYYRDDFSGGAGARFYRACVGGAPLTRSVMAQQGWLRTAVQLGGDQEQFRLANLGVAELIDSLKGAALEAALLRLASVETSNTVFINNPLYRLLDVNITQRRLEATVAVADFADYALTMDLLESELVNALAMTTPQASSDADLADAFQLPLRDTYLPTMASALAFGGRLCMGGPVALLAAARGSTR